MVAWGQGCLWGGPPARPIDLRARPVRVKRALTDRHGKSDLPCPRWLPPGPPRCRASGRKHNGAYEMSSADPVGSNEKAGMDGREHVPGANMSGANMYQAPT
jgi:hypothetical protein